MTDPRAFFKLHNGMPENPKVAGLTDSAFRALIELWCYCSRNLTDGRVASAMAKRLAGASPLAELVAAGLVDEDGDDIWMHDYLKHQQSKAEVEETRENRRKAGAAGGRAKASALASAKQTPKRAPSKSPSTSVADTDTDTDNSRGAAKADAAPKTPADHVAKTVYDNTNGMVKYVAVRAVAAKALKANDNPERIIEAMLELYRRNKPITLETVGQSLNVVKFRPARNADSWMAGT